MFPLKNRKLIRGFQAHIKAGLDGAADYVADKDILYAPFNGRIETYWGKQGGNWLRLIRDNGDKLEFAHLQSYIKRDGMVKEGEPIAITGSTGILKPGAPPYKPHKHIQIFNSKGDRLDPETYNWNSLQTTYMKITVVANVNWQTLPQKLSLLSEMFKTHSKGRLEVASDIKTTDFANIPFQDFNGAKAVDINWYRENVTPQGTGQLTLLLLYPSQWPVQGSFGTMTYGDPEKPVRCEVMSLENDNNVFVERAFHEICHALFFLTGQQDRVHEFLQPDPPKYEELLDLIDYKRLQAKLITIKSEPMNQAKIVKSKNSNIVYICYPLPSEKHLEERVSLEGISLPNPIPNTDSL
jgi:hypothetical protein